jgi:hypothetical protein
MPTPTSLLTAVIEHCRPALPTGTTLLKSGDAADASLSFVWLEFWVDRMGSPVARRTAPHQTDLSITVNCFGRPPTTPNQVQSLAETVRQQLTRLRLPISQDTVTVGLLTLLEPEMRDLSRPATQKSAGLRQWSISVRGTLHPQ